MMVLRHIPPSATVGDPGDRDDDHGRGDERTAAIPMDLSNKHSVRNLSHEVPRHLKLNNNNNNNNKTPLLAIFPTPVKRNSSGREILCTSVGSRPPPHQSPNNNEIRWRGSGEDETGSYSSPDSGLQRDSPGEDEDAMMGRSSSSPPLSLRRQSPFIPLSLIRQRFNLNHLSSNPSQENGDGPSLLLEGSSMGERGGDEQCHSGKSSSSTCSNPPPTKDPKVQTKRARLEEMVSHIKKTTNSSDRDSSSRSRRHSGDDDTSSGGQGGTSGDDEDGPTDLRRRSYKDHHQRSSNLPLGVTGGGLKSALSSLPFSLNANTRALFRTKSDPNSGDVDEPCNLVCMNKQPNSINPLTMPDAAALFSTDPKSGGLQIPKNFQPLSPSDASKMYGVDPETYQQQMMQLQLTSAAMMGDPGGLLKAMGNYPPWVYIGYYSQLLHSFQAQEILRQYAIQSQTPTISQGEKSPTIARTTLGSSSGGYNCGSPVSPASVSEGGPAGVDSDGSVIGQATGGNGNGKRAPRAMTGRHVRTGTGASPTTLQTLRLKIEERQRLKAQQLRHDIMLQPHANSNNKGKHSKFVKKFKK